MKQHMPPKRAMLAIKRTMARVRYLGSVRDQTSSIITVDGESIAAPAFCGLLAAGYRSRVPNPEAGSLLSVALSARTMWTMPQVRLVARAEAKPTFFNNSLN